MDSRWFYQAVGGSSNKKSNLKAAESDLDLSLSLGLSNKQQDENEVQLRPQPQNFTFNGSLITKEANEHAMADGTGQVGMNYNGIVAGGSSAVDSYGSSNIGAVGAAMNVHGTFPGWGQATSGYGFNSGEGNSGMNMMSYNEQALNVNQELFGTVGHNLSGYNPGGTPPLALPTMNYAPIDYLPGGEDGSSFGSRKKIARQERQAMFFDPNKRCSNPTCCTNNTPMWRKGPLGPKTLCNACGIKYRKEEERRRSAGAGAPDGQIAKADSNE